MAQRGTDTPSNCPHSLCLPPSCLFTHPPPLPLSYLQNLAELGLELKVGTALANGPPESLLQGLDPSFSLLAQPSHPLMLPLTTKPLLFCLIHLAQVGQRTYITDLGPMLLSLKT